MAAAFTRLSKIFAVRSTIGRTASFCTNEEPIEKMRARLLYQSTKRGILENDILIGGFARQNLNKLSKEQLVTYDGLINGENSEWDLYYWMTGAKEVPQGVDSEIMSMLQEFTKSFGPMYSYKRRQMRDPPPHT